MPWTLIINYLYIAIKNHQVLRLEISNAIIQSISKKNCQFLRCQFYGNLITFIHLNLGYLIILIYVLSKSLMKI